jgi:hypothetical protein
MFEKFEIGESVLYHGDCFEILPTLKNESIDFICSDPPYAAESFGGKCTASGSTPTSGVSSMLTRRIPLQHESHRRFTDTSIPMNSIDSWLKPCLKCREIKSYRDTSLRFINRFSMPDGNC